MPDIHVRVFGDDNGFVHSENRLFLNNFSNDTVSPNVDYPIVSKSGVEESFSGIGLQNHEFSENLLSLIPNTANYPLTPPKEPCQRLERPYRACYEGLSEEALKEYGIPLTPPSYPPLEAGEPLRNEQLLPIYRDPLVDLRKETFLTDAWWAEQKKLEPKQPVIDPSIAAPITESSWINSHKEVKGSHIIKAKYLEGPKEMPSGKKGRRIKRYRILDERGNEILLYMNTADFCKSVNDPFGTEIQTDYKKRLTPYFPGQRPLPKPTARQGSVAGHYASIEHEAINKIDSLKKKTKTRISSPRLRFTSLGKPRYRAEYVYSEDNKESKYDSKALNPSQIYKACVPICPCNDCCNSCGFNRAPGENRFGNCFSLQSTCIPAVGLRELFCCERKQNVENKLDAQRNVGFSPGGPVIGVFETPPFTLPTC